VGDGGWGIGDWGLGIGPNPQSPIPNPQSPIPNIFNECKYFFNIINILNFYYIINFFTKMIIFEYSKIDKYILINL